MLIRMIRIPDPGQFRGEGEWKKFEDQYPMSHFLNQEARQERMDADWSELQQTRFLPTKEITQEEYDVDHS